MRQKQRDWNQRPPLGSRLCGAPCMGQGHQTDALEKGRHLRMEDKREIKSGDTALGIKENIS